MYRKASFECAQLIPSDDRHPIHHLSIAPEEREKVALSGSQLMFQTENATRRTALHRMSGRKTAKSSTKTWTV